MEGRIQQDIQGDGEYQYDARNKYDLKDQRYRSKGETHSQISVLFFRARRIDVPDGTGTASNRFIDRYRRLDQKIKQRMTLEKDRTIPFSFS